ncbi:hypothetical protein A2U01_0036638, partial [Trifolium medium]|nr:hypothetical protein [Trifolium medium]
RRSSWAVLHLGLARRPRTGVSSAIGLQAQSRIGAPQVVMLGHECDDLKSCRSWICRALGCLREYPYVEHRILLKILLGFLCRGRILKQLATKIVRA